MNLLTSSILFFTEVLSDLIRVQEGILQGETVLTARNGVLFKAYYSIPFAEPPVGRLRFQPPLQPKQWKGILNTSAESPSCMQNLQGIEEDIVGSEDCLYLSVYTPLNAKQYDNYPVIVYLYGGAFVKGSSSEFKPHYFMQREVILVQFNYRNGPLGFLSTDDEVISGNFGLKDQTMALKWIKRNIEAFGGNPNEITLFGHSSGAMCAHFHTLSPLSRGLFHKVIMHSGNAFSPGAYYNADVAKYIAKKLSENVDCNFTQSDKILSCLSELNASEIFEQVPKLRLWSEEPFAILRPTIESKKVKNAFLNKFPNNLTYVSTSQPWLVGLTTGEGAFLVKKHFYDKNESEEITENLDFIFPILLEYWWNTKQNHVDYTTKKIMSEYFQDRKSNINSTKFMDLVSDSIFGWSFIDMIKGYRGLKYTYLYDHVSNYSIKGSRNGIYFGVDHVDDLHLMFKTEESVKYLNETDIMLSDEMITRWVNFVYSGNPNIPFRINKTILNYWEPTISEQIEYLRIQINGSMEKDIMYKRKYKFWKSLSTSDKKY